MNNVGEVTWKIIRKDSLYQVPVELKRGHLKKKTSAVNNKRITKSLLFLLFEDRGF